MEPARYTSAAWSVLKRRRKRALAEEPGLHLRFLFFRLIDSPNITRRVTFAWLVRLLFHKHNQHKQHNQARYLCLVLVRVLLEKLTNQSFSSNLHKFSVSVFVMFCPISIQESKWAEWSKKGFDRRSIDVFLELSPSMTFCNRCHEVCGKIAK